MAKKLSWRSLWYTGAVAFTLLKKDAASRRPQHVGLFVSATDQLDDCTSLADHLLHSAEALPGTSPWKVYCVTQNHPPPQGDNKISTITYIECDISNPNDVHKNLSSLTDVTHLFYVAWSDRPADQTESWVENSSNALRNVLRTVMKASPKLKRVRLQISRRHCSGACKSALNAGGLLPIDEDDETSPRIGGRNSMEHVLIEEVGKKNPNVKWSVHHPSTSPALSTEQLEVKAHTSSSSDSRAISGSVVESEPRRTGSMSYGMENGVREFRDAAEVSSLELWNEKLQERAVVTVSPEEPVRCC